MARWAVTRTHAKLTLTATELQWLAASIKLVAACDTLDCLLANDDDVDLAGAGRTT